MQVSCEGVRFKRFNVEIEFAHDSLKKLELLVHYDVVFVHSLKMLCVQICDCFCLGLPCLQFKLLTLVLCLEILQPGLKLHGFIS